MVLVRLFRSLDEVTVATLGQTGMLVVAAVLWVIGVAIAAPILVKMMAKKIRDSKERMKDPEYRATLQRFGVLKG